MSHPELSSARMGRAVIHSYLKPWVFAHSLVRAGVLKLWPGASTKVTLLVLALILLAIAFALGLIADRLNRPQVYTTGATQTRLVQLEDGSTVKLAPDTRLSVRYANSRRTAVLSGGEAFFTIRHEVLRPFEVSIGNRVVRDIGTAFNVRILPGTGTEVSVTDGRVAVLNVAHAESHAARTGEVELRAGQGALLSINEYSSPIIFSERDVARKTAWRDGQLFFEGEPLSQVVSELNRFRTRRLVIADPAIAGISVGGVFRATDDESTLALFGFLGVGYTVVKQDGGEVVRLYRVRGKSEDPNLEPSTD